MIHFMSKGRQSAMRHRTLLRVLSLTAAGGLTLAGCVAGNGGGNDSPSSTPASSGKGTVPPSKLRPIQSRTFYTSDSNTLQVDVLSLARLGNDKLKLQLKVSNVGQDGEDAYPHGTFGENGLSGVALVDGQNMKAYFPLTSVQGTVMEGNFSESEGISTGSPIYPTLFFPSPSGAKKVGIALPATPFFNDIPISGTAMVAKGEPDPTKVQLKPPRIEDVTNITDDLNGDKSVDQSGSKKAIRLNADVLFALNKAKLSGKAKNILTDVARQIDSAKATTIKVDGYTDNTGNDAINNPLSRRRAEAVASALKTLVKRSGVTYQTGGHGSADPVATNDTSAGRQKNRRVTVTIGK